MMTEPKYELFPDAWPILKIYDRKVGDLLENTTGFACDLSCSRSQEFPVILDWAVCFSHRYMDAKCGTVLVGVYLD